MNNKKMLPLALMSAFLFAGAGAVQAHKIDVDEKVNEMKSRLNLTDDQADQVETILNNKKKQVEQIKDQTHEQIRMLLSEDQRKKFEDLKDDWEDRHK